MGTGVGEAMLIGAATGAGTSALTGGDPLKGALMGGIGGAIVPGAGNLLTSAGDASATAAASQIAPGAATGAGSQAAMLAEQVKGFGTAGLENIAGSANYGNTLAQAGFTPNAVPKPGMLETAGNWIKDNSIKSAMIGGGAANMFFNQPEVPGIPGYDGPLKRFRYNPDTYRPAYADGGIASIYPPGESVAMMANGGISSLGGYSDGGRMLKGPGDGMSDSIPASIAGKQPARLADGEFVVPADVVSHLGNGSTDAGAKQLYKMMDKVRTARTGTKKQGKKINPGKFVSV